MTNNTIQFYVNLQNGASDIVIYYQMPTVQTLDESSHSQFNSAKLDLYIITISVKIKRVSLWDKEQVKKYISVPNQQSKRLSYFLRKLRNENSIIKIKIHRYTFMCYFLPMVVVESMLRIDSPWEEHMPTVK